MATKTVHRLCTLCEAHCGISVEVDGDRVLRITGDKDDPMSKGYICPKAAANADLYEDPDRLDSPVKRVGSEWVPIGWEEALDLAADGLRRIQERDGRSAVATYLGNPSVHSWSILSAIALREVMGGKNHHSATSTDQLPQHRTSAEMFGNLTLFPLPDIDRTDFMLVLGANPSVSNGSVMTAPGARHRLRAIVERGGEVVVVDPRRTETARSASRHVSVRPGGDAFLLLGMLNVIFEEGLTDLSDEIEFSGLEEVEALVAEWPPARAAVEAGVGENEIATLARDFAAAESAVAYGRVGVCQQRTGTLTHWLINVLNAVTGNLDRPGGAMFAEPFLDLALGLKLAGRSGTKAVGRWTQRVSGLPEFNGELPIAGLADEILTPGDGQVRGMLVHAGNPVLSAPGGAKLDRALGELEFMVSIDPYITETSRHADVILPPVSPLERGEVDAVFPAVSVRNHVRWSPAAVPKRDGGKEDWEILNGLTRRLGRGVAGRGVGLASRLTSPGRLLEAAIAAGPYGVLRRGPLKGLTLWKIKRARHGIDLGPLQPRLPGPLLTDDSTVRLAPQAFLEAAGELEAIATERESARGDGYDLTLIGRRGLRTNNSWMHNSRRLTKGADQCTALLHPEDATARGLADGGTVRVVSSVGEIEVKLAVSDEMRPGVVSVPHGFGHGSRDGVGWKHAAGLAGASVNDVTDPTVLDSVTGNAAYNSVAVRLEPA
ncbi:molybdopterin-dependent oxidoreductase [Thermoleophilia bacterium SCSIO 60948]|nr:molybdopterin-dependent oxidoreductase [Thermoleophilia bacterium SCSIO 60948]